ncbi:MAG: glutathione S-transferase N-terminal domain-containing protein [Methylotenera sp.]|nr:glutathione S-transferase N-terminal domain-containing protein [Methylotenera sp.]
MKLLYTVNSPYARKVRIVAAEKHIEMELGLVVLADPDCPVKQYNPLGKVPVLILDDGDSLYDSRVIVEFLDHRTPLAHLLPQDHSAKIRVRRWEALADGVCDAAVAVIMEQLKEPPKAELISKQMSKVLSGLQVLNDDLGDNKWYLHNTFSLADIAVGCTLGYLQLRFADVFDFSNAYPNLHRLNAALLKRESFLHSQPVPN